MSNYKKYGSVTIPPTKIDPDGSAYDLYKKEDVKTDSGSTDAAEIPTCTVKLVVGQNAKYMGSHAYVKYEGDAISTQNEFIGMEMTKYDVTLRNVVCGSFIYFGWNLTSSAYYGMAYIEGGAEQLGVGDRDTGESYLFRAPTEAGSVCTIQLVGEN